MTDSNMPPLARSVAWACGWLFMLCVLFLVNAFAALVGLRVFSFTLPLVIVLSLVGLYWLGKIDGRPIRKRALVLMGVSFLAAVILCGYAVSVIWEHSNWGRGFYTEAIVQLAAGWNPIYDDAASVSEVVLRSGKAFWYVDASVYAFLGHYEMAKVHTLLFAVPAFLLARHCFVWLSDGRRRVATLAALSLDSPALVAVASLVSSKTATGVVSVSMGATVSPVQPARVSRLARATALKRMRCFMVEPPCDRWVVVYAFYFRGWLGERQSLSDGACMLSFFCVHWRKHVEEDDRCD